MRLESRLLSSTAGQSVNTALDRSFHDGRELFSGFIPFCLALTFAGHLCAQEIADEGDRVIDEEPNQDTKMDEIGTDEVRSRWFFEGAELVLKPRTYYLYRDYDVADTRAGWALGGGLEFRSG